MAAGVKSRPSALAALLVLLAVTLAPTTGGAEELSPACTSAHLGDREPCVGVLNQPQEQQHPGIGVAACCDALDRFPRWAPDPGITCGFLDGLQTDFLLELGNSTDKTCISIRNKEEGLCK